jgi:hypothetical protein
MNLTRRSIAFIATLGLGLACTGAALAGGAHGHHTVKYDVAMNGFTFSFEGATNPAGFPATGTPFVIRGYIYPGGTFKKHGARSGVLADGSPEFPDRVLGTWYCRGWHLQDGDALTGPVVATTQVFEFKAKVAGSRQLITDGIELADFGVWFERSATGGTGMFRRDSLTVRQVYVDFNATNSFNTSFSIEVH